MKLLFYLKLLFYWKLLFESKSSFCQNWYLHQNLNHRLIGVPFLRQILKRTARFDSGGLLPKLILLFLSLSYFLSCCFCATKTFIYSLTYLHLTFSKDKHNFKNGELIELKNGLKFSFLRIYLIFFVVISYCEDYFSFGCFISNVFWISVR